MRICARCVLPETFPGIRFDDAGVCNHCCSCHSETTASKEDAARLKFENLAESIRGKSGYHCLLAYSGGKDSTYTLWLLREHYKLRVLAVTFDNGFVSPGAFSNIRKMVEAVNADHILVKPRFDVLKRIFASVSADSPFPMKALERASSICNACMGLVKSIVIRIAVEQQIPLTAYGWSPGQAPPAASFFRLNASMVRQMEEARVAPLRAIASEELSPYLLNEKHYEQGEFPYSVSPLAFHEYDEQRIIDHVKALGWQPPEDTDGNSSNCLLNSFANQLHVARYGFHPYAFEVAGLVRQGVMGREDGLGKLANTGTEKVVSYVAARLGLTPPKPELHEQPI